MVSPAILLVYTSRRRARASGCTTAAAGATARAACTRAGGSDTARRPAPGG